jgi:metallo-beta-lactamase family protein
VVHGEPQAAQALAERLQHTLGWRTAIPEHGEAVHWPDLARERA